MRQLLVNFAALFLFASITGSATAAPILSTLPEVDGGNGFIGNFTFGVPVGETVTSATISGTFGNASASSSGALELFLDGLLVAECVVSEDCWFGIPPRGPWSYTFSAAELATGFLDDGVAALSQVATAGFTRLGSLTLTGETGLADGGPESKVPAPATLALFGLGLAGLGWKRRKQA